MAKQGVITAIHCNSPIDANANAVKVHRRTITLSGLDTEPKLPPTIFAINLRAPSSPAQTAAAAEAS